MVVFLGEFGGFWGENVPKNGSKFHRKMGEIWGFWLKNEQK